MDSIRLLTQTLTTNGFFKKFIREFRRKFNKKNLKFLIFEIPLLNLYTKHLNLMKLF